MLLISIVKVSAWHMTPPFIENIINNYSVSDTEDKKKNDVEEEEEADHTEVVEVLPVHTSDNSNSGIIRFFAQRSKAQPIFSNWL